MTTRSELRALAEAAREYSPHHVGHVNENADRNDIHCVEGGMIAEDVIGAFSRYCFASNPETVLKLLDALELAEEALKHYSYIKDVDGALGRDRREMARNTLSEIEKLVGEK